MIILRSLLFNILFYAGTVSLAVIAMPALLGPVTWARKIGIFWGWYVNQALRVVGISHQLEGDMRLDQQVIYAAKHESAWETMSLCWHLQAPVIVLKQELLFIPFVGWFMKRAGSLGVDRKAGMKALKKLRSDAVAAQKTGRSLQIYPQGTRTAPGQEAPYQIGVYALYDATGLPVVPIALNSGSFWGKRAFMKQPGTITVSFLPPIEPGLSRKAFMAKLETAIETESKRLIP